MRLFILFSALHFHDAKLIVVLEARECSLILYYPRSYGTQEDREFDVRPCSSGTKNDCSLYTKHYPESYDTHDRVFDVGPCFANSEKKYHKRDLPYDLKTFTVTGKFIKGLIGSATRYLQAVILKNKAPNALDGKKTISCSIFNKPLLSKFEFARFTGRFPYAPAPTQKGKRNQICRLILHKYVAVKTHLMESLKKQ